MCGELGERDRRPLRIEGSDGAPSHPSNLSIEALQRGELIHPSRTRIAATTVIPLMALPVKFHHRRRPKMRKVELSSTLRILDSVPETISVR